MNIDKCREAFEAWANAHGVNPKLAEKHMWRDWQAAWTACEASMAMGGEAVAWLHEDQNRVDVIHDKVKRFLHAAAEKGFHRPLDKSERYTIPLYAHPSPVEAAVERDAARYRWLRTHFKFANDSTREIWFDGDTLVDEPSELDESIDAALTAQQQENKQ